MERTFKEFKLFGYCLKLSNEKTKDMTTDRICSHIRNFIISRPFAKFLIDIKKCDMNKEMEIEDKYVDILSTY